MWQKSRLGLRVPEPTLLLPKSFAKDLKNEFTLKTTSIMKAQTQNTYDQELAGKKWSANSAERGFIPQDEAVSETTLNVSTHRYGRVC